MKKLYKIFSVITVAILSALLIVGCSKKTTTKDDKTTKVTTTNKTNTNNSSKTTARFTTNNPTTKETIKSYSISVEGATNEVTCSVTTLEFNDGTATYVPVDLTKTYAEGTKIFVSVTNYSSKKVKLTATIGTTVKEKEINAGASGGFTQVGDALDLTGNLNLKIEEIGEATQSYTVKLCNDSEVKFSFYYYVGSTKMTCNSSSTVYEGTTIYPSVTSTYDFDIVAYSLSSNEYLEKINISSGSEQQQSATFAPIVVSNDVYLDYVEDVVCALSYSSSVEGASFTILNKTTNTEVTTSGAYYPVLTEFELGLTNTSDKKLLVNVYTYDEYIDDMALMGSIPVEGTSYTFPYTVAIQGDMTIEIVEYAEYTVTLPDPSDDGITCNFMYYDVTIDGSKTLVSGTYPKNTAIYGTIFNRSTNKIIVKVVDANNPLNVINSISVKANDYEYIDDPIYLTCDINITITIVKPVSERYKLTINNDYSDVTIKAYYFEDSVTPVEITSSTFIPKGASILVEGTNNSTTSKYKMTLYANSVEKGSAILDYGTDNEGQITFGQISSNLVLEVSAYEEVETYEVDIYNTYSNLDIELFYKDSNNEYVKITDLENIEKGTIVYVKLTSTGDAYIAGVFTEADVPLLSGVVQAGSSTFIGSFEIKENVGIETAEYSEVTITYTSIDGVTIRALDQNNNTIASGSSVFMGIIICFEIVNSTDNKVTINFEIGEMSFGFAVDANATKTTEYTAVPSDCTLSVTEYVEYTVTVNLNGFDSDITYSLVVVTAEGYDYLQSGDNITKNSPLLVMFTEFPNDPILMLTLKNGETIVYNNVITAYDYEENVIFVNGNVTITVSRAMMPGDTYTIENSIDIDDLDVTITVAGQPYVEDEEIEEETTIVVSVENNTNSSFYIYAFDADTEDDVAETKIVNPKQTIAITFNISCNVFIGCEVIDSPNMFYINDTIDNDEIEIEIDVNGEECEDLDNILEGSIVSIYVYNGSTETYTVYVVNDYTDQVLTNCITIAFGENCLLEFEIHIDACLVYELYSSTYTLINDIDVDELEVTITVNGEPLNSNKIDRGAVVDVYVTNNSTNYPYIISILDNEGVEYGTIDLNPGDDGQASFTMVCDLWIDYFEGEEILGDQYSVELDIDTTDLAFSIASDGEPINFGDLIDEDAYVVISVTNDSEYDYVIEIYDYLGDLVDEFIVYSEDSEDYDFNITSDITVCCYEYNEDLPHTISNQVDIDGIELSFATDEGEEIDIDLDIDYDTYVIVTVVNSTDTTYCVFAFDDDEIISFVGVDAGDSGEFGFYVCSDTYIACMEGTNPYGSFSVDVEFEIEGIELIITVDGEESSFGQDIEYNSDVTIVISNNTEKAYDFYFAENGEIVRKVLVVAGDDNYYSFYIDSFITITCEEHIAVLRRVTVSGDNSDIIWDLYDEYDNYYESGDEIDEEYTINFSLTNKSVTKLYKMTVYNDNNDVLISEVFYPASEEIYYSNGTWFKISSDVNIVIEETTVTEYTLNINSDYEVRVSRQSIDINNGGTIYEGERLYVYVDTDVETEADLEIICFDADNNVIIDFIYYVDGSGEDYDFIDDVQSNIKIVVIGLSSSPDEEGPIA